MVKVPFASVVADRGPWSAGEVAVTVTPGTARPCWSSTVPRIVPVCTPCALATPVNTTANATRKALMRAYIHYLLEEATAALRVLIIQPSGGNGKNIPTVQLKKYPDLTS